MKEIKKYLFTCLLLLFAAGICAAQNKETRFERIESAKIAYITNNLELSPEEAQKFFPLYNEYRKEMREISHENKSNRSSFNANQGLEFDAKVLACKKKYRNLFATAISNNKASRFFEVEREFREQLFKELESRRRSKP